MRIIGLDLSLTSTGASDGQFLHAFQIPGHRPLEARMDAIAARCTAFALSPEGTLADLAVIEGPSYGSKGLGHDELAGLRWVVRHALWKLGVPVAIVAPAALKKYTTGNGKASKQDMVAALSRRHGVAFTAFKVREGRYDMADAYALAAMGYAHYGQHLNTLTELPERPVLDFRPFGCPQQPVPLSVDSPLR